MNIKALLLHSLILIFLSSCFDSSSEDDGGGGGLFIGHKEVEDAFIISPPTDDVYSTGDNLDFVATHPLEITVAGNPRIELNIGGSNVFATYLTGSGTKNITFRYTVQAGDSDSDGIALTGNVDLNGGSLEFSNKGQITAANTTVANNPDTSDILVDTQGPSLIGVTPPDDDTYYLDEQLQFVALFDDKVIVSGKPRIQINLNSGNVQAVYATGSNTNTIIFKLVVQSDDVDSDGIASASVINLNGGSIKDTNGNNAILSFTPVPMNNVFVDGDSPKAIAYDYPTNKIYGLGEILSFDIVFGEAVIVASGVPSVDIEIGTTTVQASYVAGSGSDTLTFQYVIGQGLQDTDGIEIQNTISLNSATIRDAGGTDAVEDITPTLTPMVLVDSRVPDITNINPPADGDYVTGQDLDFIIQFDEDVVVTNTPRIPLTLTSGTIYADYVSGSGTNLLTFRHTVQAGDADTDGIAFGGSSLDLNSTGTIKSFTSGYNANLSFSGLEPNLSNVKVNESIITQLVITTQPTNTFRNQNISPAITVELRDASNNLVVAATDNVTVALGTDPSAGSATLGGTTTVAAIGGIATFSDLNIDEVQSGYTLTFSSGILTPATSLSFDVITPPATQLAITSHPTNALAGDIISPDIIVELRDSTNTLVNTETSNVTLTFGTDPSGGNATLGGTVTVAAVNGVATFNDITVDKAFTGYTLTASSGALTPDTSNSFNISPNTKSQLAFVTEPSDSFVDTVISPDIEVEIQDAFGNKTTDTDTVTLVFNNDPSAGAATLGGTLSFAAVNGTATFNDIQLDYPGTGYTLNADSGVLTTGTSAAFNINPVATQLVIVEQPTDTNASAVMTPAITVEIRDANGNLVSSATDNIIVSIGTDPTAGTATLSGSLTVAAVGGVATFSDLEIDTIDTGYTLEFNSGVLTAATSNTFDILTPVATQLVITGQPTNTVAGQNISPNIIVEIRDSANNLVTSETSNVTLAFGTDASSGSATLGGTLTVAASGGIAIFNDINIDKAFIGYTLTASSGILITDTTVPFNINPASASQLAFSVQPTNAEQDVAINPAIEVEIQDAFGNKTTDTDNVTLSIANNAGPGGTLAGTLTQAAVNGTAIFNDINIDIAGTGYTLDADTGALTTATSAVFDINQVPTQLVITQQPTDAGNGIDISPAITVEIRDAANNLVTGATDNVTVSIGTNPAGGSLTGTTTISAVGGVATFNNLSIDNVGAGYTLSFSSGVLTSATSNTFDITQAPATQLAFVQQPTNTIAGTNVSPALTVEFRDANNLLVPNETSNVTLSFGTDASGGSATLGGTLTVAAVGGVATFNDINIDKAFTGYTLNADSGVLTNGTSSSFEITPATKAQLAFNVQPSNTFTSNNIAPAIEIEIQDSFGNKTTDIDIITLSINNDPSLGSANLNGTLSVAAFNGVASFNDINIDYAGSAYTLDATAVGLTTATSNSFDIDSLATQLVITQQPTDAYNDVTISPAITVEIRNALNTLVVTETSNVTLSFGNDPSSGTAAISGTTTVAAVGGVATFNDISIDEINNGYTFDFTSGALTGATSNTFNITQSPPTQLAFTQDPTDAVAGVNISPDITVEIRDASGNLVTSATDNVTLSLGTDPSSGTASLGGTVTVAAVGGVATFSDINVDKAFSGYTLSANSGALTAAASGTFNITPGVASGLAFIQQPSDTPSDATVNPAVTVAVVDSFNNQTTNTDTITLSLGNDPSGGSANLTGTLSVAAIGGLATFSDINIDEMGLGYRLNAAASGLGNVDSDSFDVVAGAPTQIVIIQQPTTSNAGESINPAISAQLMDANNNLVTTATNTVTLSFNADPSSGTATLEGTLSRTAVGGVVTFDDITIDVVNTGYSFDLNSAGLTTATTNAFEIEAAGPSYVAFTSQPVTTSAGATMSNIVVEIKNSFGVTVTEATDFVTIRFATDPSGGSANLNGSVTKAAVNGVATFNNINIRTAGNGYTLEAEVFGLTKDESNAFNITPGPKAALNFASQPISAALSTAISPAIVVHTTDAYGNLVTGSETVTLSLNADPTLGAATLGGTLSRAAVNGVATFNDITLDEIANGYSLNATTTGLTSVSSETFGIYGPPTQIRFFTQPTNTVIGNNLPTFQVAIADANGTPVATETDTITIAFQNDASSGAANLSGTLSVAAVNGIATFSGINVDQAFADYTFVASTGSYSSVISAPFDITLAPPTSITLVEPLTSPSDDSTPTVRVATVASGDIVKVFTDASCSSSNEVASITSTGSFADVTMAIALPEGQNQLFANRTTSSGSTSACSTAFLTYEVNGAFYQLDDMSSGFGNWANVGGDDGNWTVISGETPSLGAGPTTGAGLTGNYAYTEASAADDDDVFYLVSNTLDGDANPLAFNFKWNKRGDNMGDLFVDVSDNGGGSWTQVWAHLGADIPLNGSDIWRSQFIDLCGAGYTTNDIRIRIRGVMPPDGDIWNSDMAVDDLEVSSAGCAPAPPATIAIASPLPSVLISPSNQSAFTVSGTCSDDGQNVIFSGDVSGTTTCSGGTFSRAFDLSTVPDGSVLVRADHLSAGGGANGTTQVTYTKNSTLISFDDFENGYGEWVNVETDSTDSRWVTWTGETPTENVGPSSDRSGVGNYILVEASEGYPGYGDDNKNYVLESPIYDASNLEMNIEFYWNKRGNNMGDLFLEINDGSGWEIAWQHLGQDVPSGGTDVWRRTYVDLCALGYTNPNTQMRFRGRLPPDGRIGNSDMGLDEIKVMNTGCSLTPSSVGFTTDENILIMPSIASAFPIAGTCSDNGEIVVASGDANGTTTCAGGLWSMNVDVSSRPEGDINITVTHNAASGGADGTASITFSKTSVIFEDDFEAGLGNWADAAGDDGDWTLNTGDTPSDDVGPTSGQGGAGQYVYIETSPPVAAGDTFILDTGSYDLSTKTANFQLFWNKRGNSMGDLSLQVNVAAGGWTTVWSHTGTDVATGEADIWRLENIDLCSMGYVQADTQFRLVATAPAAGAVWNGDIAVDSIKLVNNGCQ